MASVDTGALFVENRNRLAQKLKGGVVVVSAYFLMQRTGDLAAPFEQESNFWWLCGVELPGWWLVIDVSRDKNWLISPSVTTNTVQDDRVYDYIRRVSGVDSILTQDVGMQLLRELSKKHSIVRTIRDEFRGDQLRFTLNPATKKMHDILDRMFNTVQDCRKELAQLRAVKNPEEITRTKKGIALVASAFEYVKSELDSFKYEYEIEAALAYYFRRHGAKGSAYDFVVASGPRACDLGYVANSEKLKKREMVLVDAGTRLSGYVSGAARMYSYGEPTIRQMAVYNALRNAHDRIIELLEPYLALDQYQREADVIMKDALMQLGLLDSPEDEAAYRRYLPHAISHGVGVDVHDNLGAPHFFQSNMVIAVEPGVYIPEEGIGVRLRDTVLITDSGHVNLSQRLSTDL